MRWLAAYLALSLPAIASAAEPQQVWTLAAALANAQARHPDVRQAHAGADASRSRADAARAPLLPQVSANVSYQRATANFVARPGALPRQLSSASTSSFETFDYMNLGLSANWLAYDFGQTSSRAAAARSLAVAAVDTEHAAQVRVAAGVRAAWFALRAANALAQVGRDTLANQERHLAQIEAFVEVGRRPAIDRVQARADRASAQLQLINAEAQVATAKAQLAQAMALDASAEFEIADEPAAAVPGESTTTTASLIAEAVRARPELAATHRQIEAQQRTIAAIRGEYGPSLVLSTSVTEAGPSPSNLTWNWNAGVGLTWPLFQGGQTDAQLREAHANLVGLQAQADGIRQQIRLEVTSAWLAVRAAQAGMVAADEALANANVRLQLAEGRYQAGAGSIIELADAQLAQTSTAAQRVQAEYKLGTARAQLMQALGRL